MKGIWECCNVDKWQFDENSSGNVPKPQLTTHNFQLYKDFLFSLGAGGGVNVWMSVGLLALCMFVVTILLVK